MDQIHRYGNQVVVNLINKDGYEKALGDEFKKHIQNMDDARVKLCFLVGKQLLCYFG